MSDQTRPDPLANLPEGLTPDDAAALMNAKPGDVVKVSDLGAAAMFLESRGVFGVGIEQDGVGGHITSAPDPQVDATVDRERPGAFEPDDTIPNRPEGLTASEAKALRAGKPGDAFNVNNPEAAVEYVKAGYADEGVIICTMRGVQVYPGPQPAERLAAALGAGTEARSVTKAAAIADEPKPVAPAPKPQPPQRHQSTQAAPRVKPAAV